jgi:hypothetical protein
MPRGKGAAVEWSRSGNSASGHRNPFPGQRRSRCDPVRNELAERDRARGLRSGRLRGDSKELFRLLRRSLPPRQWGGLLRRRVLGGVSVFPDEAGSFRGGGEGRSSSRRPAFRSPRTALSGPASIRGPTTSRRIACPGPSAWSREGRSWRCTRGSEVWPGRRAAEGLLRQAFIVLETPAYQQSRGSP